MPDWLMAASVGVRLAVSLPLSRSMSPTPRSSTMKKMMLGRPVGVVDREAAGAADEDWVPKKEALAPLCAPPLGKRASATAADTPRARRIHRHEHKRLIYRASW